MYLWKLFSYTEGVFFTIQIINEQCYFLVLIFIYSLSYMYNEPHKWKGNYVFSLTVLYNQASY